MSGSEIEEEFAAPKTDTHLSARLLPAFGAPSGCIVKSVVEKFKGLGNQTGATMRGMRWGLYFGRACILAVAVTMSLGLAEVAAPAVAPSAPAPAPAPAGCNIPRADVSTASIVQATGDSLQRKRWQPHGGVIQFTINSFAAVPEKASFVVCFRWKTTPENTQKFDSTRPDRLERNNDGMTWKVTTTVPARLMDVPAGMTVEMALPLVPIADVRIIAVKEDKTVAADVTTTIGITYPWAAIVLAVATIVLVLLVLTIVARVRLQHEGIKKALWLLRIISTPGGYASLSQLQIVLWTLVVAASAVYVMALSGDLIEITNGTLVLLGIAGVAGLGAKAHSESQKSTAQAAADTARQNADKATIDAAKKTEAAAAASTNVVATAEKAVAENTAIDAKKWRKRPQPKPTLSRIRRSAKPLGGPISSSTRSPLSMERSPAKST